MTLDGWHPVGVEMSRMSAAAPSRGRRPLATHVVLHTGLESKSTTRTISPVTSCGQGINTWRARVRCSTSRGWAWECRRAVQWSCSGNLAPSGGSVATRALDVGKVNTIRLLFTFHCSGGLYCSVFRRNAQADTDDTSPSRSRQFGVREARPEYRVLDSTARLVDESGSQRDTTDIAQAARRWA